jgi:hypothetical protein
VLWPIAITKDGLRSKVQPVMDASAGLDPFRAEIRLLQIAAEIDGRMVAMVIDLRRVRITSPALEPLWKCRLIGHNLSFDAKMLLAHGIEIPDENILDTILMAGLVLRGQPNKHRLGSRRPSLGIAAADPEKLKREDHWSLLAPGGDVSPPRSGEALPLIQKLELGQGDLLRLVCLGFGLHLLLTFLLHPLVDANGFRIACGGPGGLLTHPSILDNLALAVLSSDQNSPHLTLQKRSRRPNDPAGPPQPNACDQLSWRARRDLHRVP